MLPFPDPFRTRQTQVFVFRTNVVSHRMLRNLEEVLSPVPETFWTVDLEDADRILRVETSRLTAPQIRALAHSAGVRCDELD